jgi:UDP-N-acetylmuramate--alanine ligase
MSLRNYHIAYFIGIGGIGMSALARWCKVQGMVVMGYDRTTSLLTSQLEAEGMVVHYTDEAEALPQLVKENKSTTLVVYTPAIPPAHPGMQWLKSHGYTLRKRAEVLGEISRQHVAIAVAGTHGKTSTSGMITHILHHQQVNVIGVLGGILQEYESNFIQSQGKAAEALMVLEADEFDRSFLQLRPDFACITSMDADHLDVYGQPEALHQAYLDFALCVPKGGELILQYDVYERLSGLISGREVHSYGIEKGDYAAENVRVNEKGQYVFDARTPVGKIRNITMRMPGIHNVENAMAACALLHRYGMDRSDFKAGVESYKGVKRRFEMWISTPEQVYIDDYAHHPTELRVLLQSVRMLFKGRKVLAIFQPHLYSRTRDFAGGFASSLSMADEVWLLPIYPAREEPIEGVSSEMLLPQITVPSRLVPKEEVLKGLEQDHYDVVLTLGAGDIDRLVQPILELLKKEDHAY